MGLSTSYGLMEDIKVGRFYTIGPVRVQVTMIQLTRDGNLLVTSRSENAQLLNYEGMPGSPSFLRPTE